MDVEPEPRIVKTEFFYEEPFLSTLKISNGDSPPKKSIGRRKRSSSNISDQSSTKEIIHLRKAKRDKERHESNAREVKEMEERTQESSELRKLLVPQKDSSETKDEEEKKRFYELQQQKIQAYERRRTLRKISKIQMIHSHVSQEECELFLKDQNQDEDEAVMFLTVLNNLTEVRKRIAVNYQLIEEAKNPRPKVVKEKSNDEAKYIPNRVLDPSMEQYEGQIRIHYRKHKKRKIKKK